MLLVRAKLGKTFGLVACFGGFFWWEGEFVGIGGISRFSNFRIFERFFEIGRALCFGLFDAEAEECEVVEAGVGGVEGAEAGGEFDDCAAVVLSACDEVESA